VNATGARTRPSARLFAQPELWILTAISAALHFWRLFTPSGVVFDEVHFEHFAGYYLDGGFVFDVHPPLARLLYGAEARMLGLSADALIGGASAPALRILPALFGIAIIPLVYALLQQLRASRKVATFASIAILLDNALLVDTRLVMADVFLITFGLIAIDVYLAARNKTNG
jgi:dolichyl-phosphate-mannose-protein mannosyltransferase